MGTNLSFSRLRRGNEVRPCYLDNVPDEILEAIFVHLEPRELLATVQYVCKSWHTVTSKPSIWRLLCMRHGLGDPLSLRGVENYQAYFFILSRNLIRNAWATQKLEHWTRDLDPNSRMARDGFKVEICFPQAVSSEPLPEKAREEFVSTSTDHPLTVPARSRESTVGTSRINCWATTYYLCEKSQLVDLIQVGLNPDVMKGDDRPDILVSVWTAPRRDCASIYVLSVRLLREDKSLLDQFEKTVDRHQWSDGQWEKVSTEHELPLWANVNRLYIHSSGDGATYEGPRRIKVTHLFSPLPPETKYVEFHHSGKDQQFWAGHYGPKFTGATVKLVFRPKSN